MQAGISASGAHWPTICICVNCSTTSRYPGNKILTSAQGRSARGRAAETAASPPTRTKSSISVVTKRTFNKCPLRSPAILLCKIGSNLPLNSKPRNPEARNPEPSNAKASNPEARAGRLRGSASLPYQHNLGSHLREVLGKESLQNDNNRKR